MLRGIKTRRPELVSPNLLGHYVECVVLGIGELGAALHAVSVDVGLLHRSGRGTLVTRHTFFLEIYSDTTGNLFHVSALLDHDPGRFLGLRLPLALCTCLALYRAQSNEARG
jgi:hypothetical protein